MLGESERGVKKCIRKRLCHKILFIYLVKTKQKKFVIYILWVKVNDPKMGLLRHFKSLFWTMLLSGLRYKEPCLKRHFNYKLKY